MAINSVREKQPLEKKAHQNNEGGASFFLNNPVAQLRMAASSCFFGEPKFYQDNGEKKPSPARAPYNYYGGAAGSVLSRELGQVAPADWSGKAPKNILESAIDNALDFDAEATLKEAVRLRTEEFIRTTPQVILVRAAHHKKVKGTGLVTKYAPQIIQRGDEPAVGMAYHKQNYKGAIPNSLKKAWKTALESLDDYCLAKYRMESRIVKTVDVVNLVHASSPSINKLMKGELKTTGETWEAIISLKGSTRDTWIEAVGVMGHMALLRNLRNLEEKGVDPKIYLGKLVSTVERGKQLPFRYLSAYDELLKIGAKPQVLDAIEECLEKSIGNLPHFEGRGISLADNSGSMWSVSVSSHSSRKLADIANLTGVITGKAFDEGYVGIFGTIYEKCPVRKKDSIFSQTRMLNKRGEAGLVGHGTDLQPFFRDAIKNHDHYDHIFIYSDMQVVGQTYKSIMEYRQKVNPKVLVYLVQVAGYVDTLMPDFYNRTFCFGGWGPGLLNFAAAMSKQFNG